MFSVWDNVIEKIRATKERGREEYKSCYWCNQELVFSSTTLLKDLLPCTTVRPDGLFDLGDRGKLGREGRVGLFLGTLTEPALLSLASLDGTSEKSSVARRLVPREAELLTYTKLEGGVDQRGSLTGRVA